MIQFKAPIARRGNGAANGIGPSGVILDLQRCCRRTAGAGHRLAQGRGISIGFIEQAPRTDDVTLGRIR